MPDKDIKATVITCVIRSQDVEDYLKQFPGDPEFSAKVNEALEIGVAVLQRVSINRDVEFVKKEMETLFIKVNESVHDLDAKLNVMAKEFFDSNVSSDSDNIRKFISTLRDLVVSPVEHSIDRLITNAGSTIELMLNNAGKVSTSEMEKIGASMESIKTKLNPDDRTSYLGILREQVVKFQQRLEELVDDRRNDSFAAKLKAETEKYFGSDSPILTAVMLVVKEQVSVVNASVISLREEIARKEGSDSMLDKISAKGFDFEVTVEERLAEIARTYGDVVINTAKETKGTSKKGDFIYEFSSGQKIVIECKDVADAGLKPMLKYLGEAMTNREVDFGILLTKKVNQLPAQVGVFNLYEGNKLFTHYDVLEFSVRWVRLYLLNVKAESVEGINSTKIKAVLEKIQNSILNIAVMRKKLNAGTKFTSETNDSVCEMLETMRDNINSSLLEVEAEIIKQ